MDNGKIGANQIKKIIINTFNDILQENITLQDNDVIMDVDIDSLSFISLITCLEEEYNIEFDEDEFEIILFSTIQETAEIIYKKLEAA